MIPRKILVSFLVNIAAKLSSPPRQSQLGIRRSFVKADLREGEGKLGAFSNF